MVAIERAPSPTTATLWAATRIGRVFVTTNADDAGRARSTFHRIDTPQTPGRFVTGIAIDPADPNHAWVSYTGYDAYTPDTPGHVFEVRYDPATHQATFDDRRTTSATSRSPRCPQRRDRYLFAGTDFGVLGWPRVRDVGAGRAGLPHVAVYGLTISQTGQVLFAATHGRGAYSLACR